MWCRQATIDITFFWKRPLFVEKIAFLRSDSRRRVRLEKVSLENGSLGGVVIRERNQHSTNVSAIPHPVAKPKRQWFRLAKGRNRLTLHCRNRLTIV